jgi:hypothetical protein
MKNNTGGFPYFSPVGLCTASKPKIISVDPSVNAKRSKPQSDRPVFPSLRRTVSHAVVTK